MAGNEKGVAARISAKYPTVPYVHCFCHKLNLSVMKVVNAPMVQDMFDNVRVISDFFAKSPKRTEFYEEIFRQSTHDTEKRKKLINVCRTRYIFILV